MEQPNIDTRIFVVGVPRSGTTLVQSLLAAHDDVTSFTESHFFSRHFRLLPPWSTAVLVQDPGSRVREFLQENVDDRGSRDALLREQAATIGRRGRPWPWHTRSVARELLDVLDRMAVMRGCPVWVEKTAQHLRYVPFLERLHEDRPPVHFVHVVRDGLEVVSSLYVASQSWPAQRYPFALGARPPYDLETCVRRWNRDVAFSLRRVASGSDHVVFYEDLTSRPEETLERVLGEIGLTWQPDIVERYWRASGRLIADHESWKHVDRRIRASETSQRVLTATQRDEVSRRLRSDLYGRLRELVSQRQAEARGGRD